MSRYKIGVVGYGDFTKLILEYLMPYAHIVVYSRSHNEGDAGFGAEFSDVATVLSQPIIIPAIPSQFFGEFFSSYHDAVNPSSVVIDVCSVKVRPLAELGRLLPKTCQIIGTHPMFGPSSVAKNGGIKGFRCAVCPVRADEQTVTIVEDFLQNVLDLRVIRKTPAEHDREMAYVQGVSHYIGRVMDTLGIPESELATLAYEDLLDMKRIQGQDSWELFMSIMKDNPYAAEVHSDLKNAIKKLDEKIGL
jgi:prephenate dehydrogenase